MQRHGGGGRPWEKSLGETAEIQRDDHAAVAQAPRVAPPRPPVSDAADAALRRGDFRFQIGPFATRLALSSPLARRDFRAIYGEYPQYPADRAVDFHLRIAPTSLLRRWVRPNAMVQAGIGNAPFVPLPADLGFLALESAMNWMVATTADAWLMFHAGVVARKGRAVMMPGLSGAGKSTLTAGLAVSGWRLFSDEFALLRPETGLFHPYPRPVSLKNRSIDIIAERAGADRISRRFLKTPKGTVAYLKPPEEALRLMDVPASPALLLFPEYRPEERARIEELRPAELFALTRSASINCDRLGETAFTAIADLVARCRGFRLFYGNLDQGMTMVGELMERVA